MIFHIFDLPRDEATDFLKFGYTKALGIDFTNAFAGFDRRKPRPFDDTMLLGDDLVPAGGPKKPLRLPLVKTVEHIEQPVTRLDPRRQPERPRLLFRDVFVERLCTPMQGGLLPLAVKYRMPAGVCVASVYRRNLQQVHNTINRVEAQFSTPGIHYVEALTEQPVHYDDVRLSNVLKVLEQTPLLEYFTPHALHDQQVVKAINSIRAYLMNAWIDPGPPSLLSAAGVVDTAIMPHVIGADPITVLHPEGVLSPKALRSRAGHYPLADFTAPAALAIDAPETVEFSPAAFSRVAEILDSLHATDLEIEYTLSNGAPTASEVRLYGDRFPALLTKATRSRDELTAAEAVREYAAVLRDRLSAEEEQSFKTDHPHPLLSDARVRLRRTYGDEAMLELFPLDSDKRLHAVHLDLAMLAVCSLGVLAT